MFKTTADYLEIFLVQGVVFSNDSIIENCYLHWKGFKNVNQEVAKKVKDYS